VNVNRQYITSNAHRLCLQLKFHVNTFKQNLIILPTCLGLKNASRNILSISEKSFEKNLHRKMRAKNRIVSVRVAGCIHDNSRTKAREIRLVLKVWYKCQDELIKFWDFYVRTFLVPSSQNFPKILKNDVFSAFLKKTALYVTLSSVRPSVVRPSSVRRPSVSS
jgi:hypothetical protein